MTRTSVLFTICLALSTLVHADEVDGIYRDLPTCDNHGDRVASEELGDPAIFSKGQQIDHAATFISQSACLPGDNPNIPNALVVITNRTNRSWTDLYYVGDPTTQFTNVDGFGDAGVNPQVNGLAFRIDSVGVNRPLVFESAIANNVFEPGEQWHFIVQDFSSPIGPADSFTSVGFADASVTLVETSAASIVHFVPEPATTALLGLGLITFSSWGRRRVRRGKRS